MLSSFDTVYNCTLGFWFDLIEVGVNLFNNMADIGRNLGPQNIIPCSFQIYMYSGPSLIRPLYLQRNCGHISEVAFGVREK